jgi:hypothetical protein
MNSRPVEAAVLRRQSYPIITILPVDWGTVGVEKEEVTCSDEYLTSDTPVDVVLFKKIFLSVVIVCNVRILFVLLLLLADIFSEWACYHVTM